MGPSRRAFHLRLFTLFACLFVALLGLAGPKATTAAASEPLLAALQPATASKAAVLSFYSAGGALVHELTLPVGVNVDAAALAPDGRHWLYVSGAVSGPEVVETGEPLQADLTLHILNTSNGAEVIAIPLLPANFPANIAINAKLLRARDPSLIGDEGLEEALWQAFKYSLGYYAWSPDGKQLAFSAATDGPSSDIYLYDTTSGQVRRLSDGIEQIEGIRWSPDGQWIWHTTIAYGYCQVCAGHNYAVAADGSAVVNLPGDDIYRFLSWVDGDSYLTTDQSNGPGDFALQRVDIPTGKSQMLWSGTHQSYLYDPAQQRLGIIGTREPKYAPDSQVFVVDLATGAQQVYDDLASALAEAPWLKALDQRPINYPCRRPGPLVYPCVDSIYDPLSPDGQYLVQADYAVTAVASGKQLLPALDDLATGNVLWRTDGKGFWINMPEQIIYRDLATGELTSIDAKTLLGWLPAANASIFAPLEPLKNRPTVTTQPTTRPTPVITPEILSPYRQTTLVGSYPETVQRLRTAHTRQLAAISQAISTGETAATPYDRQEGLNLLLAHEAAATYLYLPSAQPDPALAGEVEAALDAALAPLPPRVATYPATGRLPTLYSLALSPNGKTVATGDFAGNVRLWDYASGALLRVLPTSLGSASNLQFSSDSTMIAAVDDEGSVQMWYVESGIKSSFHQGIYNDTQALAWRPYSYDLAIANGSSPLMIHPRDGSAYALLDVAAEALAYSPDGTQLAVALQPTSPPIDATNSTPTGQSEQRPIWIVDADSGALLHELSDDATTYFMSYTPDGKTLVVNDGYRLRGWAVHSATLLFETKLDEFPNGWAITPQGNQIALLTRRAGVTFYDLSNGKPLRSVAVDANVLSWLAINAVDGVLVSGEIGGLPVLLDPAGGATDYRFGVPRARLVTTTPPNSLFPAGLVVMADIHSVVIHDLSGQRSDRLLDETTNYLTDLSISPDGRRLAARDEGGALLLWDLDRGRLLWQARLTPEWAGRVAFAAGDRLVMSGSDGVLRLVSAEDGSLLGELALGAEIAGLAVSSRNEATLIVGKPNGMGWRVDLDDLAAGAQPLPTAQGVEEGAAEGSEAIYGQPAYSPDGSLLAIPRHAGDSRNLVVELWETATSTRLRTLSIGDAYSLDALAFSPDGKELASGGLPGTRAITLWDVATGAEVQALGQPEETEQSLRLAFSPDGSQLFASELDALTSQYSLTPSHQLRTVAAHRGGVWDVDVDPNGRWAITAGDDHRVRLWDWQTGEQQFPVIEEPERIYTVAFSPNGDAVLTGGEEGIVRLYYPSGELQNELPAHESSIVDAIFRPDGKAFATASDDGSVRVWNRARLSESWRVEGLDQGVGALAYSPDSSFLAASAGGGPSTTIYLWDAYSGEEIRQFQGHKNTVVSLAFSPDGTLLASASWDQTIKLWDVSSGEEVATLEGHSELLTDLAFSPDGKWLASVAEDCTLRLWEVASGREAQRIDLPRTLPWAVAFSPDGHALLTTHADGTLRTWLTDLDDDSLVAKTLRAAARFPGSTTAFTAAARAQYAIDSYVGADPLSISGNANLRTEPYVQSLIVQPAIVQPAAMGTVSETLIALTNESFLLTSADRGESWRIVTQLPLTRTYYSLGIPARAGDPLLITSDQGLFQVDEDGALTLVNSQALLGVSYSQSNPQVLWGVGDSLIYKSEDGGATWGEASNNLAVYELAAPLLSTAPNDNPQVVAGQPQTAAIGSYWRGAGNGFWEQMTNLPMLPPYINEENGLAWDAGNRTLYLSGAAGELFAATNVDAANAAAVSATLAEQFGVGRRPIPLAVGAGPSLYVKLITPYAPRFLRGVWDGNGWQWVELRLPIIAAG